MRINRKAIIFGIKSFKLSKQERKLFIKEKPWGIILFSRNVKNITQLKTLTSEIRKIFNDKKFPILIDEEGGKISRLFKIIDLSIFSQSYFGKLYINDKKSFVSRYKIYIDSVCNILNLLGININTVPVLDVKRKKAHKIIGNRSFSNNPLVVSKLGNLCVDLFKKNKIGTVIKHIPGHGLSKSDSHFKTPKVNASKIELIKKDFKPFKASQSNFAMTAHIIYKKYDNNVATHSKIIIKKNYTKTYRF